MFFLCVCVVVERGTYYVAQARLELMSLLIGAGIKGRHLHTWLLCAVDMGWAFMRNYFEKRSKLVELNLTSQNKSFAIPFFFFKQNIAVFLNKFLNKLGNKENLLKTHQFLFVCFVCACVLIFYFQLNNFHLWECQLKSPLPLGITFNQHTSPSSQIWQIQHDLISLSVLHF